MKIKKVIDACFHHVFSRISKAECEIASLKTEIALLKEQLDEQQKQYADYKVRLLSYIANGETTVAVKELPKLRTERKTIDQAYAELEHLVPHAYKQWTHLFEANQDEYISELPDSCSVDGNRHALRFQKFIAPYLKGYVLDIGCGPQAAPLYVSGYPLDRFYGIDPLPPHDNHPFRYEQAIAEFLPFQDNSFQTVIAGTSLDHVLLPDQAFAEIARVLEHGGMFLVLAGFIPGPDYDPYQPDVKPIDSFHMFHFNEPWLEELFRGHGFQIMEHYSYEGGEYYACMLEKRASCNIL